MASSRKWAGIISCIASCLYFTFIVFQVPILRVRCRFGICKSPMEVISSQLIASEIFPTFFVKALLCPGAIAKAFAKNQSIQSYSNLFKLYNLNNAIRATSRTDLHHLEIIIGSYLSVAGAVLGLLRPGRMSLIGTLVIVWGSIRELLILRKISGHASSLKAIQIYPAMSLAALFAFLSIQRDVQRLLRCFRVRRVTGSSQTKEKFA